MIRIVRLRRDRRGVTIVEFALVAPVLLLTLLGGLEAGHTMYVRSVLLGQVHKAARDIALEDAAALTRQDEIKKRISRNVRAVINNASVDMEMKSYRDYSNAEAGAEDYVDRNNNGRCDNQEGFVDANNNGVWDAVYSSSGRGGAKDVVVLSVTVAYPRMLLSRLVSSEPDMKLSAQTLLRNQPSDNQASAAVLTCRA